VKNVSSRDKSNIAFVTSFCYDQPTLSQLNSTQPNQISMTTTTSAHGLNYSRLLDIHKKHKQCWKWATERRIKDELGIPSGELELFHSTYGLPRLKGDSRRGLLYSLPALEAILETITELHDCNADYAAN